MAETSHLSCLRKRRPQWPGGRFSWRRFRGVAFIAAVSIEVREVRSGDRVKTMGRLFLAEPTYPPRRPGAARGSLLLCRPPDCSAHSLEKGHSGQDVVRQSSLKWLLGSKDPPEPVRERRHLHWRIN